MEMKTTKQIMVHNVKRAPNYWGKIRFFCFTTGPDEGPTGAETPLVAMLKEALITEDRWSAGSLRIFCDRCGLLRSANFLSSAILQLLIIGFLLPLQLHHGIVGSLWIVHDRCSVHFISFIRILGGLPFSTADLGGALL